MRRTRDNVVLMKDEPPPPGPADHRADEPRADLRAMFPALAAPRSAALVGLFVLALFYTLYFARAVVLPVTLAVLGSFLLRPIVRALQRLRIPEALGAAIVLVVLGALLGFGVQALAGPAADLVHAAPQSLRTVEAKLRPLRRPVEDVSRATEQVERFARGQPSGPVVVQQESFGSMLATGTVTFVVQAVLVAFLLYFLLASGQSFVRKLSFMLRSSEAAERIQRVAHEVEREVSEYLLTVTLINLSIGIAIGVLAWQVGLTSPLLWGIAAAVMNYIPYLGALVVATLMTLTAVATLPLETALLVPLFYAITSSVEAYLVTPVVVGRTLTLDPVAVFLGVIFWGWLWGVAGALIAVPLLVVVKITCEHFDQLAPVAALLGQRRRGSEKAA